MRGSLLLLGVLYLLMLISVGFRTTVLCIQSVQYLHDIFTIGSSAKPYFRYSCIFLSASLASRWRLDEKRVGFEKEGKLVMG